jgi:CO/xanthine dehydrogenase FAD-binding subunit
MLNLKEIHKPTTIADALKWLQQPNTVVLAGGTQLIADKRRDVNAVVDLSALGLAYIRESDGAIVIGATTTLTTLAESPILRALANGIVAQAAHRSASSILRNQATSARADAARGERAVWMKHKKRQKSLATFAFCIFRFCLVYSSSLA